MNNYQELNDKENNSLLNFMLYERFFKYWKKNYNNDINNKK